MSVAQMLHHLNLACGGSLGFYALPDESYSVSRTVFRWILVDWFPEQPVGLRLSKGFNIPHSAQFDFEFEKAATPENHGCRRACKIGGRLGAAPHVRIDDSRRVGQIPSDPHRSPLKPKRYKW